MKFPLGVGVLWAVCAGFALGVFIRSTVVLPDIFILVLSVFALISLVACAKETKKLRFAIVGAAALLACGLGILRMESAIVKGNPTLDQEIGKKVFLEGIISDEPDTRATQVRVPIRIASSSVS